MKRIIIVDDEPDLVELMCEVLEDCGYELQSTTDPVKATDLMMAQKYSLAIVDLKMPVMNGMDLVEWIRAFSPETKIVVCTGFVEQKIQGIPTLRKPFRSDYLLMVVCELLEGEKFEQVQKLIHD